VLIIGSGPIRAGIEFDYSTVHAVTALREDAIESTDLFTGMKDTHSPTRSYWPPVVFFLTYV